jgi:hypothetical protein
MGIQSVLGSIEKDQEFYSSMAEEIKEIGSRISKLNDERPKHGPLLNFTKPAGIVTENQLVLGREVFLGCQGDNCFGPIPQKGNPI